MELNQKKGSLIIILRHKRVSLESMPHVKNDTQVGLKLQIFCSFSMVSLCSQFSFQDSKQDSKKSLVARRISQISGGKF